MEDLCLFTCDELPELMLCGSGKFRTPRLTDGRVPVLVLPPDGVLKDIPSFGAKAYAIVEYKDDSVFSALVEWCESQCEKPMHEFMTRTPVGCTLRLKLPAQFCVRTHEGSLASDPISALAMAIGTPLACAVEMPFLWENANAFGLTLQLVECQVATPPRPCLIVPLGEDEEPPRVVSAAVSTYESFTV
jgi:hypothetical protein